MIYVVKTTFKIRVALNVLHLWTIKSPSSRQLISHKDNGYQAIEIAEGLKGAEDYLKEKVVYVTAEPDGYQYFGANECNVENITEYMTNLNFTKINHPNTHDPTFVNNNFLDLANKIYISQK